MENINKYKQGQFSVEELESFTYDFMRAKYDEDRKDRWQGILANTYGMKREGNPERQVLPFRKIMPWIGAAAAAILIGLFLVPFDQTITEQTYAQMVDQFLQEDFLDNQSIIKGDQDASQLNIEAILAYNQQDFTTAINKYQAFIATGNASNEQYFFLGMSYLYNEQYADASLSLQEVTSNDPSQKFLSEAQWFVALAYLKNEQLTEARSTLLSIETTDWNYEKAQRLLSVLDWK